ncbi:hypothetical protein VTO73DRAFT_8067 [Trametes versicolor]
MDPEDHTLVEIVETFVAQLKQQTCTIFRSEAALLRIRHCMAESAADVQALLNARRSLLSLPTELLQNIMTLIPDAIPPPFLSRKRPVWHVGMYDTTMVILISQTCRRLREVAVACSSLWTDLADRPRPLTQSLTQGTGGLPLNACLPVHRTRNYDLTAMAEDLPRRVRELHVGYLSYADTDIILHHMFSSPLPTLETLCVHFGLTEHPLDEEGGYTFTLPLTTACVPNLRRLYLYSCDLVSSSILSSLTHVALHDIQIRHLHTRIESVLSACGALQFLHLDRLTDQAHLYGAPRGFSLPTPAALPSCRRLRRVSLTSMDRYLASYLCSLICADQAELVLQLHEIWSPEGCDLVRPSQSQFPGGVSRLAVGRYPFLNDPEDFYVWGMSACGSRRTLRTTTRSLSEVAKPLLQDATAALADVRELWLADIATPTTHPLSPKQIASLKAVITSMPRLDTIILANHFQSTWAEGGRPSLFLLPNAHETPVRPSITTLRIVHGYGPHLRETWEMPLDGSEPVMPPLDLTGLVDELASGAYDYLEHLMIEVPSHLQWMDVDGGDVARLRAYFKTMQVRVVDETPTMALPEYCVEPSAWPRDVNDPWPRSIW